MKIHITLTARDIHENELRGKVAVVIDVLRATSVMVTALANGAVWVRTTASVDQAVALRETGVLLGGERHALPIEGFDFGNSPLEYTPERVNGKGIVITTTNGTAAISRCGSAEKVLIGAFLNQRTLSHHLINLDMPVELVCAGTNGEFSMDDFLCAGMICTSLNQSGRCEFDDLGRVAMESWQRAEPEIHTAISNATHYNILKNKGFDKDLQFCLKPDTQNILVGLDPITNRFHSLTP